MLKKAFTFFVAMAFLAVGIGGVQPTFADSAQEKQPVVNTKAAEPAVVTTETGKLMGYKFRDVYRFLGVPYGTAERFEAPQKVQPWKGTRTAFVPGKVSSQNKTSLNQYEFTTTAETDLVESEDCLNLNVWTKNISTKVKKPVIVFLHGGGLTSGSSDELTTYDGANLAAKDVVFVSINHRLNVIGFLDLSAYGEKYKNSGNASMADIVLSLQWVRNNIAQFGGDPNNVTIYGQSGGGEKVATIMALPAAQGLFNKAVIASSLFGARTGPRTKADAQAQTDALVKSLGITGDPVEALKAMSYTQLREAADKAGVKYATVLNEYYPQKLVSDDGVMLDMAKNIPLMYSTTFSEFIGNGVFATSKTLMDDGYFEQYYKPGITNAKVEAMLAAKFGTKKDAIVAEFKKAYPGHSLFSLLYIWTRDNALVTAKAKQGGAPVYQDVFAWEFPMFGGITSAHTTGDFPFFFNNPGTVSHQIAGKEVEAYKLADLASSALVSFMQTGNPSTKKLGWSAFTVEKGATMVFDVKSEVRNYHDQKLIQLIKEATTK